MPSEPSDGPVIDETSVEDVTKGIPSINRPRRWSSIPSEPSDDYADPGDPLWMLPWWIPWAVLLFALVVVINHAV